nr:RNA-directed DNA polymerase, eukaryota [Tanacetum cinerariifolium]
MHLQANVVRYERVSTPPHKPFVPSKPVGASSYVSALKGTPNTLSYSDLAPAIILEDLCLVMRDFDNFVMGEIKEFSAINNLRLLLATEGFTNVKLSYLGGLWVMIELDSTSTKAKFMQHVGVASWFVRLCNAQADFVSRERIVWVDIEGVPLHAWSQSTFKKIRAKWGEVMDLKESKDDMFARKRICVKTKQEDNILERFKIIARGKVFVIRAKELFMWSPIFKEPTDSVYGSDNESVEGDQEVNENGNAHGNLEGEGNNEAVSDTFFDDSIDHNNGVQEHTNFSATKEGSYDPFNVYDLLNKQKVGGNKSDTSIPYPPGFTPNIKTEGFQRDNQEESVRSQSRPSEFCSRVVEEALAVDDASSPIMIPSKKRKTHHTISVNFVAVYGTWIPSKSKLLLISIYAPQLETDKRVLWSFISDIINCWDGECVVMGDFNEVRVEGERMGSVFSVRGARDFNNFISSAGLVDIQLEGYSFTWSHPSATKTSKLDRFLVSEGFLSLFPHTSAICLDKHLSDHRPILLRDVITDYGATPFRFYHSWLSYNGFEQMAVDTWNRIGLDDSNDMIRFKKKLQILKKGIRSWVSNYKKDQSRIMVDGVWVDDPPLVKDEFRSHFAKRFQAPGASRSRLNFQFPNRISMEQTVELENNISHDEIRNAVWSCGEIDWFFLHSSFAKGCNSSFIALIPKAPDVKFVSEYRPISLIGCPYKVVTKILATRLSNVISDLVADVQTAFLPNRQILDGPFIINEDFLDDVLDAFGFGAKWRSWVFGSLSSCMASIIINGSPAAEFKFYCGLKQGDPLAPYLFILIMESFHLSFSKVIDAGLFKGIKIDPSTQISYLFYANDAVLLVNGLIITSRFGVSHETVHDAAISLGCAVMRTPFKYLGVMVGGNKSLVKAWDEIIGKLKARLSKWKCNTLSIGGRLTLLKSVLGSTPIYTLSLYKAPKAVLNAMESIRRNFFYGMHGIDKKIACVKWSKILAAKEHGGLGVSSFFALNRALLFKWVWRFISYENSLWSRVIHAIHGPCLMQSPPRFASVWGTIVQEVQAHKSQGVDLLLYCRIRVGNGLQTSFWKDHWIGDSPLCTLFPLVFLLETSGDITVADKMHGLLSDSFRRPVRGGIEAQQLAQLQDLVGTSILSTSADQWVCNLSGDGTFHVKNIRCLLDEFFLPNDSIATCWVKFIPIKINVFAWRVCLDRLPTRMN